MVYMACKMAQLKKAGYAIVYGLGDPPLSSSAEREAVHMPIKYHCIHVKNLFEFVMCRFPCNKVQRLRKIARSGT